MWSLPVSLPPTPAVIWASTRSRVRPTWSPPWTDGCTTYAGLVGIGAAILAAGGVAIVAVLTLRAMSEWEAVEAARADDT